MKIRLTKADVLDQLRTKLPEVEAFDKEQLAAHRDGNKGLAARRRVYLRRLLKMGNDRLAEVRYIGDAFNDDDDRVGWPSYASCPLAQATRLKQNITWIEADARKSYTLDMTDTNGIPAWLNWVHPDTKIDKTVCA